MAKVKVRIEMSELHVDLAFPATVESAFAVSPAHVPTPTHRPLFRGAHRGTGGCCRTPSWLLTKQIAVITKPLNYCQNHNDHTNHNSGSTRDRINFGNCPLQVLRSSLNSWLSESWTLYLSNSNSGQFRTCYILYEAWKSVYNSSAFVRQIWRCSIKTRSRSQMVTLLCDWHTIKPEISLREGDTGWLFTGMPASVTMQTVATVRLVHPE
jgi:hypothetical protein